MRHLVLLASLVSLPLSSRACINDRDSDALAVQNKRLPDAIRVISGRFERNPPRYYQMRAARVEAELKSNPLQFALYDDLAVAHDRLGDDKTAMRVMACKRVLLPPYKAANSALKEAWYRYYANDGTFRAHRFLHDGAKVQNLADMKRARAEIQRAIQIKPNAHFGREKYQLAVMDWIIARKTGTSNSGLGDFLQQRFSWEDGRFDRALSPQRQDAAQGLSGLIVLGSAWQSPDVFNALGEALESRPTIALSHLARKRSDELQSVGAVSLSGEPIDTQVVEFDEQALGLSNKNRETLDALYPQLRTEANQWNAARIRWMEAKFEQGSHPDTDAKFWASFPETAHPSLDVEWLNEREDHLRKIRANTMAQTVTLLGIPILLIILFAARYWKRSRRQTLPT